MSTNPSQLASYIPNPYNLILGQKHGQVLRAVRFALGTVCDPKTGQPVIKVNRGKQLRTIQISAAAAGDNIIIPALPGIKQIFELVLWNVTAQTMQWQQGSTASNNAIRLLRLTNFPDTTGFTLGFNGNFEMPHWEIDQSQPLILNLQNATQVDGFIRYRVANGTS